VKIYTRRGDEGETDLWDMSRVPKSDPRVEAYGTVDELNTVVGRARPTGHDDVDERLAEVQNQLFVVQADFANPAYRPDDDGDHDGDGQDADEGDHATDGEDGRDHDADGGERATDVETDDADGEEPSGPPRIGVRADHVDRLEAWIDEYQAELPPLESFVLPGGSEHGAALHHARAVCRRAERRAVALAREETVNGRALTYLNRLSDALFVMARAVNHREDVPEESPSY
jgi:cob(I)alamin adenosyltransferase